jgi:hypothetical protein
MENVALYEDFTQGNVEFNEGQISRAKSLWNTLNIKYTTNPFFLKVYNKMQSKKHLTKKQWIELDFLLKNGKSRYDSGILPKNY